MKIVYLGNFASPYTTENDVRKAFEYLGHQVDTLQENQTSPGQLREAAFASDLVLITGTWDTAQPLSETVDTLRQCAMRGIATATLHLDLFFGGDRGERKWWLHPMFFTSHVFTADGSHQREWAAMGINHHWLRPAVRHDAVYAGTPRPEYACDVAFVGSNGAGYHEAAWPYRKQLLAELRCMCQKNGWSFRNPGGDDPKIDRGEDLNDFYASARVTVGDSLCLEREKTLYCSDRVFEATGRGGLLVMPQLDFLEDDFSGVLPMYPWGDFAELERVTARYLEDGNLNRETRQVSQELVGKGHTYVQRIEEMLEVLRTAGAIS